MATLVTGATGFIGSHVARRLARDGERVKILLRKSSRTVNIEDIDAELTYGDVLDRDSVLRALKGCDSVIHTAGLASFRKKDYRMMEEINVVGTENVLSAALEKGVSKAVYTSSIAAIGVDPEGGIADEHTVFNLSGLGIKYLDTKNRAEKIALEYCGKGLPVSIVNPSTVIGPGDIYLSSTAFILWYCKRKFPGYMEGTINLTDVEDVAVGHVQALKKARAGERYILGNKNLTLKELFSLLEDITGIPGPKFKIPYFLAYASGYFVERVLGLSFPNYSTMDIDSVKLTKQRWHYDCSKAVQELGYPQSDIEETVRKTISWFKENGYM